MRRPSAAVGTLLVSLLTALLVAATPAAAQPGSGAAEPFLSFAGSLLGAAITLVIGLVVVAVAPDYTDRMVAKMGKRPGEYFVTGLVAFVAFLVLVVVLAVTVVGVVLYVVLIPAAILVGIVSHALVSTFIGRVLFSSEASVLVDYLVGGILLLVVSQVPFLGGLVNFVLVTCLGTGAVVSEWAGGE
jgi:hypothetical protein